MTSSAFCSALRCMTEEDGGSPALLSRSLRESRCGAASPSRSTSAALGRGFETRREACSRDPFSARSRSLDRCAGSSTEEGDRRPSRDENRLPGESGRRCDVRRKGRLQCRAQTRRQGSMGRPALLSVYPIAEHLGFVAASPAPPVRVRSTASIVLRQRAALSAGSLPTLVGGAAPDAGRQASELAPAKDPRPAAVARPSPVCGPLPPGPPCHPADQPAGAPEAPPTAATPPEATRRPVPAATPMPVPPRYSRPAKPRSPAGKPTTPRPGPGVCGPRRASAGRPWPGARGRPRTAATTKHRPHPPHPAARTPADERTRHTRRPRQQPVRTEAESTRRDQGPGHCRPPPATR
jgi:hypothetical protein